MAALLCSLLLSLCLAASAARPGLAPTAPPPEGLKGVCSQTQHPDLCVSALSKKPESQTVDTRVLAEVALRVASEAAAKTTSYVKGLADKSDGNEDLQQYLSDCLDSYEDAEAQLDNSIAAMDSKKFEDVILWVAAAVADEESCKTACQQAGPSHEKRRLFKMGAEFSKLAGISLVITNLLV